MSYKKITACILIAVMTICMSGCGNSTTVTQLSTDTAYETQPSQEQQTGSENITEPNTEEQRSDEAAEKPPQLPETSSCIQEIKSWYSMAAIPGNTQGLGISRTRTLQKWKSCWVTEM